MIVKRTVRSKRKTERKQTKKENVNPFLPLAHLPTAANLDETVDTFSPHPLNIEYTLSKIQFPSTTDLIDGGRGSSKSGFHSAKRPAAWLFGENCTI